MAMRTPLTGAELRGSTETDMRGMPDADKALAALERYGQTEVAWMLGLADYPPQPCGHPFSDRRHSPYGERTCMGCRP